MRLKSLTLDGFKSFPDRTRLDFGPGVSVVVGPNGSGKSNVTDAVLWAMGEQSPLAVRGQSMQDVIFGGGRGVQARSAAEVEIVLDNCDGTVDLPLSEISIVRRLDRNGEGGYRLNGARCRLTDVIELLSDTGLGKESHSVISQGRVDSIVISKPRERRLLIEEAAGLGKHRKRRRRAQLKLEHTQENLDRALDIEREARTRLRPLKRQAEAAELHERLEQQVLQARWELVSDDSRARRAELREAESAVARAREERERIEARLQATIARRGDAERALAERAQRHEEVSRRAFQARSSQERIGLRCEQAGALAQALAGRIQRAELELSSSEQQGSPGDEGAEASATAQRIAAVESELAEIAARRAQELERELADLEGECERQAQLAAGMEEDLARTREAQRRADEALALLREGLAKAERSAQEARREAARVGAELAAANQFLRSHARAGGGQAGALKALSEELRVQEGYELALAAVLGARLDAPLVVDLDDAERLLDRAGAEGGTALVCSRDPGLRAAPALAGEAGPARPSAPAQGARRLAELVSGPTEVLAVAERLLADAWVLERLEDLAGDFSGIAVTPSGRVWFAAWGEVRQLSEGGSERVLARRNERDRLIGAAELAAQAEHSARAAAGEALERVGAGEAVSMQADGALRSCERRVSEATEALRRTRWLIEQRSAAPAEGPLALRRAELEGELAAERRQAERAAREHAERRARVERMRAQLDLDRAAAPRADRLAVALAGAVAAVGVRIAVFEHALAEDRQAGEEMTVQLRGCAAQEAEIQALLRSAGERVTAAEVAAQRLRDQAAESELELAGIAARIGHPDQGAQPAGAGEEPGSQAAERLQEHERAALGARIERLVRRREQLGPVNPLAQEEHAEALARVEELETQRSDLEVALRELRGVIRETDRQIQATFQETFTAAARNFQELVGEVFPGGSGSLRLISDERVPHPVLGGQALAGALAPDAEAIEQAAQAESEAELAQAEEDLPGVEIEITPAGKATKRLSLLSGGEKSMTALAFLFAVFLARPCPFYILDEVEAALDDLNLDRFLGLLRRYAGRAQFIVITHQKRTMEAADWLYGVSMAEDGVSKVLSRRLPAEQAHLPDVAQVA